MNEVHDVPLGRVGVAVFELKNLVYSILFESWELDKQTQQSCQVLANDEILFPANLPQVLVAGNEVSGIVCSLTPSRSSRSSFLALFLICSASLSIFGAISPSSKA